MKIDELKERAERLAPVLVEDRRALHRIPENGFEEHRTQAYLLSRLEEMGIPCRTERTWIVADLEGPAPGPVVALRADMDALPITEPEGCPFRSGNEGFMHACGHDAHMAVQLGAARVLSDLKESLRGRVRLLFQPAEETVGGAEPMVRAGVMEGVDAVYGLHVQPYMNVGVIDSRPGCLNAATDEVTLTVRGRSGHAARPEQCVDAIVCAAQTISLLQTAVSRGVSPLSSAVLSFGTIAGGDAPNVICDRVRIRGTLRTTDPKVRETMKSLIRRICLGAAEACGAQIDVDIRSGYAALINDPGETERVFRLGRALLGEQNVRLREAPSMGGEDFSYFAECAPGAFWHLGCSERQPAPTLHSRDLIVDERCLPIGVAMECALVLDRMGVLEE